MKLIVNADDFGLCKGVNFGIIEGYQNGIVTSTTVMVNKSGFEHAVQLSKENPGLKIGVHLTLTSGKPVLQDVKTLVDENGCFFKLGFVEENSTKFDRDELYREFDAQIKKAMDSGMEINHLDSHHHVHFAKGIAEVVCELAKKYNLPVRKDEKDNKCYTDNDIMMTEHFTSAFYKDELNVQGLIKILDEYQDGTLELMCHPAYVDAELIKESSYYIPRTEELAVLCSDDIKQYLKNRNIELTAHYSNFR